MLIPNNQYYFIYLNLYLYLSSDGLFTCNTLTREYWHLKLALQLNKIKVNLSPHKHALLTYFFSCGKLTNLDTRHKVCIKE